MKKLNGVGDVPFFILPKMSKPCQGIAIVPMKVSEMVSKVTAPVPIVAAVGRYVPPSARKPGDPLPTLTAGEMASEKLFPTLGGGATWSQIQTRLKAPALSFKKNVQQGIERERLEAEEGVRRELITDPHLMTDEQLERNGWHTISLKNAKNFNPGGRAEEPEAFNWDSLILTPDMIHDPAKLAFYTECTNMDGTPIERKKAAVNAFAEDISYDEARLQRAKDRMWAFVGKRR